MNIEQAGGSADAKQARTNARTWRKKAVQIVEIHRSANGATRANLLATVGGSQAATVAKALRATLPAEARLYAIAPEAGSARTVREAIREAVADFQAGAERGLPGQAKPARRRGAVAGCRANLYRRAARESELSLDGTRSELSAELS